MANPPKSRDELKGYFTAGKIPTEENFFSLIESMYLRGEQLPQTLGPISINGQDGHTGPLLRLKQSASDPKEWFWLIENTTQNGIQTFDLILGQDTKKTRFRPDTDGISLMDLAEIHTSLLGLPRGWTLSGLAGPLLEIALSGNALRIKPDGTRFSLENLSKIQLGNWELQDGDVEGLGLLLGGNRLSVKPDGPKFTLENLSKLALDLLQLGAWDFQDGDQQGLGLLFAGNRLSIKPDGSKFTIENLSKLALDILQLGTWEFKDEETLGLSLLSAGNKLFIKPDGNKFNIENLRRIELEQLQLGGWTWEDEGAQGMSLLFGGNKLFIKPVGSKFRLENLAQLELDALEIGDWTLEDEGAQGLSLLLNGNKLAIKADGNQFTLENLRHVIMNEMTLHQGLNLSDGWVIAPEVGEGLVFTKQAQKLKLKSTPAGFVWENLAPPAPAAEIDMTEGWKIEPQAQGLIFSKGGNQLQILPSGSQFVFSNLGPLTLPALNLPHNWKLDTDANQALNIHPEGADGISIHAQKVGIQTNEPQETLSVKGSFSSMGRRGFRPPDFAGPISLSTTPKALVNQLDGQHHIIEVSGKLIKGGETVLLFGKLFHTPAHSHQQLTYSTDTVQVSGDDFSLTDALDFRWVAQGAKWSLRVKSASELASDGWALDYYITQLWWED